MKNVAMRVSKNASKNQPLLKPIFARNLVAKTTPRALLQASWRPLGASWGPLGALLGLSWSASWSLLLVFRLPWPPQGPPNLSRGAPKKPKRVPKHLPKGCQDAFQTFKISTHLAFTRPIVQPFNDPIIQHLSRPGGTRGAIK